MKEKNIIEVSSPLGNAVQYLMFKVFSTSVIDHSKTPISDGSIVLAKKVSKDNIDNRLVQRHPFWIIFCKGKKIIRNVVSVENGIMDIAECRDLPRQQMPIADIESAYLVQGVFISKQINQSYHEHPKALTGWTDH